AGCRAAPKGERVQRDIDAAVLLEIARQRLKSNELDSVGIDALGFDEIAHSLAMFTLRGVQEEPGIADLAKQSAPCFQSRPGDFAEVIETAKSYITGGEGRRRAGFGRIFWCLIAPVDCWKPDRTF